jgi:hypothetical protein
MKAEKKRKRAFGASGAGANSSGCDGRADPGPRLVVNEARREEQRRCASSRSRARQQSQARQQSRDCWMECLRRRRPRRAASRRPLTMLRRNGSRIWFARRIPPPVRSRRGIRAPGATVLRERDAADGSRYAGGPAAAGGHHGCASNHRSAGGSGGEDKGNLTRPRIACCKRCSLRRAWLFWS